MAVKDGEKFVAAAIESVLSQTFKDFEFIIVDDGSSDSTGEIIENFSKKDDRILTISNEENIGLTKSLNKAITLSTGTYIARMDADDISLPERLQKQVEFLGSNPACGMIGSWAEIIDVDSKRITDYKYPTKSEELKKVLINYNPFVHSSIVFRKSIFEAVGLYDEDWRYAQDYELFFRIAEKYEIANVPEILIRHRIDENSITRKKNRKQAVCGLRARWSAIRRGQYPFLNVFFLLRPITSLLLPYKLRKFLKG